MFQFLFPDKWIQSTYEINFKKLYEKGYRGVIFDIDNTLVGHGMDADVRAITFFQELKNMGWETCLLSNNNKKRVLRFNQMIQTNCIYNARKPSVKNYIKACEKMGTSRRNTVFVGDQLFTDIWGAKRSGIFNILVKPMDKKEIIQIAWKRYLEKIVLFFYMKEKGSNKE